MNPRFLGIFVVLALVVGISAWLHDSAVPTQTTASAEEETGHNIDFYMEAYDAVVMNDQGKPSHRIVSPRMVHFPDDDATEFDSPYMTVFRDTGMPWQITSKRGWAAKDNDYVLLTGDVKLRREKSAVNEAIQMDTERLRVRPDDEYAETDTRVTMRGEKQRTVSNGMRAYLAKGQLQLLGKVRTHYEN